MQNRQSAAVEQLLRGLGIDFSADGDDFLMLLCCGEHKFKTVLSCGAYGVLTCYSVFPFYISDEVKVRRTLDGLNGRARLGCFLLRDERRQLVYRIGAPMLDEFSFEQYAKYILMTCASVVCEYWDTLRKAASDGR